MTAPTRPALLAPTLSVADASGRVSGGHAGYGCIARTTGAALLVLLPGWAFTREADPQTGFAERVMHRPPG